MKWSWKIARIAGIDIYVHVTFLFLLYLFGLSYWKQFGTASAVFIGVGFILALFACVVAHEYGHSLVARRYGIGTRSITLLPIGGVAALEKMPDDPYQEIRVALAGPAVNFVICTVIYLYLTLSEQTVLTEDIGLTSGSFLHRLMLLNLFIGLFNLLPAFPMDGGRVLRAALATRMPHAQATQKAATIGQYLAMLMAVLGIMYNPFLLFIAVFIWFGASAENSAEQIQSTLANATAGHALITEFHVLTPTDQLADAVRLTLAGEQKDFPVVADNQTPTVLHHRTLLQGLQQLGEQASVAQLTLPQLPLAQIDTPLTTLLESTQGDPGRLIGIVDGGQLIGLINLEHIIELIRIQEAVGDHRWRRSHRP